VDTNLIITSI